MSGPALAAASATAVILFTDIVSSTALTERMGDARFEMRRERWMRGCGLRFGTLEGARSRGSCWGMVCWRCLVRRRRRSMARGGVWRCRRLGVGVAHRVTCGGVIREEGNVFGGAVNIASDLRAVVAG